MSREQAEWYAELCGRVVVDCDSCDGKGWCGPCAFHGCPECFCEDDCCDGDECDCELPERRCFSCRDCRSTGFVEVEVEETLEHPSYLWLPDDDPRRLGAV